MLVILILSLCLNIFLCRRLFKEKEWEESQKIKMRTRQKPHNGLYCPDVDFSDLWKK